MGTKTRQITTACGIVSLLGLASVAGAMGGDGSAAPSTRASAVQASADAFERQALMSADRVPGCDLQDFAGSADASERHADSCSGTVVVLHGSADSMERQARGVSSRATRGAAA